MSCKHIFDRLEEQHTRFRSLNSNPGLGGHAFLFNSLLPLPALQPAERPVQTLLLMAGMCCQCLSGGPAPLRAAYASPGTHWEEPGKLSPPLPFVCLWKFISFGSGQEGECFSFLLLLLVLEAKQLQRATTHPSPSLISPLVAPTQRDSLSPKPNRAPEPRPIPGEHCLVQGCPHLGSELATSSQALKATVTSPALRIHCPA